MHTIVRSYFIILGLLFFFSLRLLPLIALIVESFLSSVIRRECFLKTVFRKTAKIREMHDSVKNSSRTGRHSIEFRKNLCGYELVRGFESSLLPCKNLLDKIRERLNNDLTISEESLEEFAGIHWPGQS